MTNDDYIRKAVELADGWMLRDTEITGPGGFRMGWIDKPWQWGLDALAAQLVRQVDAPNTIGLYSNIDRVKIEVFEDDEHGGRWVKAAYVRGPDRTMNTIRAIVDSGVLAACEEKDND